MIAFVNGILDDVSEDRAVVDVNGIGMNVNISTFTASILPPTGDTVKLYTYTVVREDMFQLYGFLTKDELNMFKKLITVSGVGPKGALAILSVGTAEDIRFAILSNDHKLISSATGIGKKTAERVVLELHDKLKWNDNLITKEISKAEAVNSLSNLNNPAKNEAVSGLIALGYGSAEAHKAVNAVDGSQDMDAEAIMKQALKNLYN